MDDGFLSKVSKVVKRLVYATEIGRISWSATDRDAAFVAELPNQAIVVATVDDDGQAPFEIIVLTKDGGVIDVFNSKEIGLVREMEGLHQRARRNSAGIDKVLNEMLEALPEDPNEPPF
jgi:hypothetical protein